MNLACAFIVAWASRARVAARRNVDRYDAQQGKEGAGYRGHGRDAHATAWWVAFLVALVGLTAAAQTTQASRNWDLFAYGSPNRLWYAVTTPVGAAGDIHTYIRAREAQGKWEEAADFPARLTALSDADSRGLAAIAGGEWKRIAPGQFTSGLPLPGGADLIAISADDQATWTIATAGKPPASAPTTQAATTVPTNVLRVWRLGSAGWREIAVLPPVAATPNGRPLALIAGGPGPMIAFRSNDPAIANVFALSQGQAPQWTPDGELHAAFAIRKLTLMHYESAVIAWACGDTGGGAFFLRDGKAWKAKPITLPASATPSDVAAASFHGELRLLGVTADEKFFEQRFDRTGDATSPWQAIESPEPEEGVTLGGFLEWGALFAVVIVTLATANRGTVLQVAVVNKVRIALAPLPLRLAAGLVDLWPFYIAPYLTLGHLRASAKLVDLMGEGFAYRTLAVALGVYFLHTVICELVWGRSLGKMFVGLRVVGVDGQRASVAGVVLRNLIRLIEVPIAAPLAFIFLNPLRQRFGDFFAATVVTVKLPRELEQRLEE